MINCPKCNTQNLDNSKFCSSCGFDLNIRDIKCPKCSKSLSPNSRFCDACGYNLTGYNDSYEKPFISSAIYDGISSKAADFERTVKTYPGGPKIFFARSVSITCVVIGCIFLLKSIIDIFKAFKNVIKFEDLGQMSDMFFIVPAGEVLAALLLFFFCIIIELLIDIRNKTLFG